MRSPNRRPHRATLAITAAVLLVAAAGAGLVASVPTPEIFWPDGTPYGPLQDDVWAQVYIEFTTRYAAAFNARDFSDPRLGALIGDYHEIGSSDSVSFEYMLGPLPLRILDVVESEDATSAEVTVCEPPFNEWATYEPAYSYLRQFGSYLRQFDAVVRTYTIEAHGGDLRLERGTDAQFDGASRCALSTIQVGYFVPLAPHLGDRDRLPDAARDLEPLLSVRSPRPHPRRRHRVRLHSSADQRWGHPVHRLAVLLCRRAYPVRPRRRRRRLLRGRVWLQHKIR
jgi:hypothetical protein